MECYNFPFCLIVLYTISDPNQSRGGRLARRARSFKDDFLGRLNQMRSPSGTRAASPCKNTKSKVKPAPDTQEDSPLNQPDKVIFEIIDTHTSTII